MTARSTLKVLQEQLLCHYIPFGGLGWLPKYIGDEFCAFMTGFPASA